MSDLEVSLSPVSPAADDHPILDYVDAPTPDTMGVSPDRVASGKKGKRTRRRPASARPPSPARVDTHWDTTPGRRGTTAFTARVIGEAQGGDLLTRDGFRKNQRRTPEPAVVFGPPEWRPTRRRFKNKAEMKASVERLTRSAAHMRLDNYMDLHERQAGFGRADRPATARYGGGREETGGGGRMRPGTAPPGGFSHLQAAGRLYPFGGQTRRLSSYEQDLMIGRLYTVKQSPPPPDMPKGWTRYKIEDGTVRTYFHEAPKISAKEYTERLVALDARCKEQEAKTQKKLTDKWLGPLYKPKVYAGADKTQEMLSRTERLFKGESALEKSEVQKALRQQRRSRMAAS